jgi:D-3-phosphoglycerate dehydrogenase
MPGGLMMVHLVVLPEDVAQEGKEFLIQKGYKIVIGNGKSDKETLKGLVSDADALLLRSGVMDAEIIDSAPKLKVIARHGVGYDTVDIEHCTKKKIRVTYAPMSNANAVAEHTLALMFAIAHHVPQMDKRQRGGDWEVRKEYTHIELVGKTLGLIGTGRIGTLVAKKAAGGLGMRVLGYDPYAKNVDASIQIVNSLDELLQQSDVVSIHVPSTPETRGMFDFSCFSKMKRNALFLNCARGELLNENDLCRALTEKVICGAALDVFAVEPTTASNPLFKLDNIVVVPHCASFTDEALVLMALHAAQGIDDVLSGKEPEWPVNHL